MIDLARRYRHLIAQMTELYAGDDTVVEQLRQAVITDESWDSGCGGGHLRVGVPTDVPPAPVDTLHAWSLDSDETPIEIIWHFVNGRLNWAEWVKSTGTPITDWPPQTIRRLPPTY